MTPCRATGLLIIEVRNSHPGSSTESGETLCQQFDNRGKISPFTVMRKACELVENKKGPVWCEFSGQFSPDFDPDDYYIFRNQKQNQGQKKQTVPGAQRLKKFWDLRIFGNPEYLENVSAVGERGTVQCGIGVSIAPVRTEKILCETVYTVQDDAVDEHLCPFDSTIVIHGVYALPFFINPSAAVVSGCSNLDIDLFLKTIPYLYSHTASWLRPAVCIRHAWFVEHKSPLGSCVDFDLVDALTPRKKEDPEQPSTSWDEYDVPVTLPQKLQTHVKPLRDLIAG